MTVTCSFGYLEWNFRIVNASLEYVGSCTDGKYRDISGRVSATGPSYQGNVVQNAFGLGCDGFVLGIFALFQFNFLVQETFLVYGFQTGFLFSVSCTVSQNPKFSFSAFWILSQET